MENITGLSIDKSIYIDLDSLLDTRWGLLKKIDKNLAFQQLISLDYFKRLHDEFYWINNQIFIYYYEKRNKSVLINSYITKNIELINAEIELMASKKFEANESMLITLEINTYPYKLSEQELKYIKNAIRQYIFYEHINITFINYKPSEITLADAGSKYSVMIMYDGIIWLDYHILKKSGTALSTKLYIPALLKTAMKFNKEKELELMFNAYNELYGGYIDITAIPLEFFNIREAIVKGVIVEYLDKQGDK